MSTAENGSVWPECRPESITELPRPRIDQILVSGSGAVTARHSGGPPRVTVRVRNGGPKSQVLLVCRAIGLNQIQNRR